ncbi:MAG: HPr(Ser) kinase/phosphatase [Thioalkalivibrionaceae bacterium]
MHPTPNLGDLVRALHARYGLEFIRDEQAHQARAVIDDAYPELPLAGHLNRIRPNRLQIVGDHEAAYLAQRSPQERQTIYRTLAEAGSIAVIFAEGAHPDLADFSEPTATSPSARSATTGQHGSAANAESRDNEVAARLPALMRATVSSHELSAVLRYHLQQALAPTTLRHGVFMEIIGTGVLIEGESSVGKSEVALELVSRGHRLIADDAPRFTRIAPDILRGECPALLQDLLEVRGLGVLNIRAMYGDSAIKQNKYLRLIISLKAARIDEVAPAETRLDGTRTEVDVLGVPIPCIRLPIAPGRNIAVLIEAAVRNHFLHRQGYNAADDLRRRQRHAMLATDATAPQSSQSDLGIPPESGHDRSAD